MSEQRVSPQTAGANPARQAGRPTEEQLRRALRTATDLVRADYTGQPIEDVCRRLLVETRLALPSEVAPDFTPDMEQFCQIAVAIVRGIPLREGA
ncbi:hypothetical protein GCM10027280_53040 [Micromonospora polyrhachis]|uniref:Uncharacterized protein n=1 Tax=Micromonospora polyrhachis TaxID=1282883 RepID=A0A7W7SVT5_9ACTN|nr:hypothetical protein [Micromonospora polyrhachis]MBB4961874.1 hypothetical protein [Micromonospora polyrhachis]